jgi:hypothetical protein
LLNEDTAEYCESCEFREFAERPPERRQRQREGKALRSALPVERRGGMVALKCRTPGEAQLVLENLESAEVVALMPNYEEMVLQYENNGYVEVQIPADVYDSSPDLRAMVEFSISEPAASNPATASYTSMQKFLAGVLGVVFVPGLIIFAWQLTHHREAGEEKMARDLKFWFLVGIGGWVFLLLGCMIIS